MSSVSHRGMVYGLLLAATTAVCTAQIPFFSPADSSATVKTMTGQVSVLKDGYPWVLHLGSTVLPQQIVVTGADGFATLQVSDGSTFDVFPNSRVTFRANPGA